MKTIHKNFGYLFTFIKLMKVNPKKFQCTLCLFCAVAIVFSCIPISSMTTNATVEEYLEQSFELYPDEKNNEKYITLNGIMPENAFAEAVDVTEEYSDIEGFRTDSDTKSTDNTEEAAVLAAYDISITGKKGDFQPIENKPILVEIVDPKICAGCVTELWHITDDGKREQIYNFTVKDGKLSFYATGFSVYAIVNAPEPYIYPNTEQVTSADALSGTRANAGFYLFLNQTSSASNNRYISSDINSKNCLIETTNFSDAAVWYFEPGDNGSKMYTYVNGVKKYLHNIPTNNGRTTSNITEQVDIELSDTAADSLEITFNSSDKSFLFSKTDSTLYMQHSKSGDGIRYFNKHDDQNNTHIKMIYADTVNPPADMYNFNGRTYGLMRYPGGTLGYGLMADSQNNALDMTSLVVRNDHGSKILYVAQDCDISMWTFHSVSQNIYTLSANVNGVTKYLRFSGDTLSLADDVQNATPLSLTSNGSNIMLSSKGKSIRFDGNQFSLAATNENDSNQWLYLTKLSGLEDDDYICYSADKISVSDVKNKSLVIIYTRIWNDTDKRYDFYVVDHDGTLYPCYERGDNIMWVGNRTNTMQWEFIEYTYDDGTPKYYYELYNPYSRKYIAPQIKDGQVLSDSKIGINMPGRREGEYYTDIVAWDDLCYTYAGLKNGGTTPNIISAPRSKADTYYFAVVEKPIPSLTEVQTIDNNEYGIKMKMIDFPTSAVQNSTLGTIDTTSKDHSTKGLLSTQLNENGYPTTTETNINFKELFNNTNDVNHLFTESIYNDSGYFEFDSCQNFATLYDEQGHLGSDFIVYKELGTTDITSKSTLKHGQFFPYDTITAGQYSTANPENLYGAVAVPEHPEIGVLPETDPRKYERLHTVGNKPNYYNGMEMEASFVQTPNGKDAWGHDIIFEFTGDDDFWLYVDGELIIDLGGIHSALAGNVNFATGVVVVEKQTTNLRELFKANYEARNPDATTAQVNAYLAKYFKDGQNIFKDYSQHTMKLFYMERGAGASNLHMRFNISNSSPTRIMLTKDVTGSEDIDFNLVEYPFQIWYKDQEFGDAKLLTNTDSVYNVTYQNSAQKVRYAESYTPPNSTAPYHSVYFLNPGMSADVQFPEKTVEYRIIECGINSDVYDHVYVNGSEVSGTGTTNHKAFDSGWKNIKENQSIVFENHVASNALRTLSFQKVLYNRAGKILTAEDDSTPFNFRLALSKSSGDTPSPANMYKYHVTNPDGYLCRWDVISQNFAPTETKFSDIETLTDSLKEQVTFETSMNGAVSKIPTGYTVQVPNLPVGTKFMITEREKEIPLGYQFMSYEKVGDTYFVAEGDPENIGCIRKEDSPFMLIKNKCGWGMEAKKIWSDSDCTSSHAPIYTAVFYNKNELVPGTVRKLEHPNTSVRYYFDSLKPDTNFADYSIYEVIVTNPVFDSGDSQTVISYDSILRLENKNSAVIEAVPKNTGISHQFHYIVEYTRGEVHSTAPDLDNVKTDTITNTRTGGIVITLYDMNTKEPLANGIFTLKQGDTELGTFTSDSEGRVTVMYDFIYDTDYTLTETAPPGGYIGLPDSAVFSVGSDNSIALRGNEEPWQLWYPSANTDDHIIAYIDLFNKPYTLKVIKEDSQTRQPLKDAHFALYRSTPGVGGYVKDINPMPNCDDLVTDSDGTIPFSNHILLPGRYYLTEITPPDDYQPLNADIIFTISDSGNFAIKSDGDESFLTVTEENEVIYFLHIPNDHIPPAELTVTKTVQGNFGNVNKDFTFTFTVESASAEDEYEWSKNGVSQAVKLHSGETFTLKHDDTCTIILPKGKVVTISENSENYTASFQLGTANAETVNTKTFVIEDNIRLSVTNTLEGSLPTGINMGMPVFLIIMAVSLAGTAFLLYRRKMNDSSE